MFYLVYLSTSFRFLTEEELKGILIESRKSNLKNKITGLLLYCGGTFIQELEGEEQDVMSTYYRITHDDRHQNIIKLISGPEEGRIFPQWTMGFAALEPGKPKKLEGYLNPIDDILKSAAPHKAITVLKTYVNSNKLNYNLT